ncbi:hypothetical protein ARMSODRAFT_1020146 [Armillaria solidipes]|uniref:DUF6532 domain-containing protein n=1 Tax=Armillaria solidipes TaxID=1076256 RepID=A0A2H3BGS4_9AGAR|nr:hypothetical protein ARMSODRAFT_1020146 [Armillaria solidipes]
MSTFDADDFSQDLPPPVQGRGLRQSVATEALKAYHASLQKNAVSAQRRQETQACNLQNASAETVSDPVSASETMVGSVSSQPQTPYPVPQQYGLPGSFSPFQMPGMFMNAVGGSPMFHHAGHPFGNTPQFGGMENWTVPPFQDLYHPNMMNSAFQDSHSATGTLANNVMANPISLGDSTSNQVNGSPILDQDKESEITARSFHSDDITSTPTPVPGPKRLSIRQAEAPTTPLPSARPSDIVTPDPLKTPVRPPLRHRSHNLAPDGWTPRPNPFNLPLPSNSDSDKENEDNLMPKTDARTKRGSDDTSPSEDFQNANKTQSLRLWSSRLAPTQEEIHLIAQRQIQHCGDLKADARMFVHNEQNPLFCFQKGADLAVLQYNHDLVKALKSKENSFVRQDPMGTCNLSGPGYYQSPLIGMIINERYFNVQHGKEGIRPGFFPDNEIPFTTIALVLAVIECAIDEYEGGKYKMVKFATENYGQKKGDGAVYMQHLNGLKEWEAAHLRAGSDAPAHLRRDLFVSGKKHAGVVEDAATVQVSAPGGQSMFTAEDFAFDIVVPTVSSTNSST